MLIGTKLLKETILSIFIDAETGLYIRSGRVKAGDAYWDKVPLKILNVRWSADSLYGLYLNIKGIGGASPYHSTTMCGERIIEKMARVTSRDDSISINLRASLSDEHFPLQCIVKITDKSGQRDTAVFTVPKWVTGGNPFCWVANPWYDWGQGKPRKCRYLFRLKSGGIDQEQEKRRLFAEKEWDKIGNYSGHFYLI